MATAGPTNFLANMLPAISSGSTYAWENCDDLCDEKRLSFKENAVEIASSYLDELQAKMEIALRTRVLVRNPRAEGMKELREWIDEKKEIMERHRNHEILVGVAGATGVGKSSVLNALLESQEFLPSSCEQAATAVACQVSWNHDVTPGRECRAEITFESFQAVEKQVQEFINAVRQRELIVRDKKYENEEERIKDLAHAQTIIDHVFGKIKAVWDLELEEAKTMSTNKIMQSRADVLALLDTTMYLHDSDPDGLSQKVKPYLDSTAHNHGGGQRRFAAWPLVKHVRQYIRADVLRYGVSLVDLPGLGDTSDGRAAVAERYYEKLAVTMIVAPIIRAADDKIAMRLLSEYQELRLQMDGRFHKRGFGVILSKTDDISIEALRKRPQDSHSRLEAAADEERLRNLDREIRVADANLADEKKELDSMRRKWKTTERTINHLSGRLKKVNSPSQSSREGLTQRKCRDARNEKEGMKEALLEAQERVLTMEEERALLVEKKSFLLSRLTFYYTCVRNNHVRERIQADFRRRQQNFYRSASRSSRAESRSTTSDTSAAAGGLTDSVEVIPVSSMAFWKVDTEPLLGFPTAAFTGIPRAKRWIWEVTASRREEHLDATLNSFCKLLNWVKQWSQMHMDYSNIAYTRSDMANAVSIVHSNYQLIFTQCLRGFEERIMQLDPLRNRIDLAKIIGAESKQIIGRWHLKHPNNEASSENMHWLTYQANLTRHGSPFRSRGGEYPIEYRWIESLMVPVLAMFASEWNQRFNQELPALLEPMVKEMAVNWDNYLAAIDSRLASLQPELAEPYHRMLPSLDPMKTEVQNTIRTILNTLSGDAAATHPRLLSDVQRGLSPVFNSALRIQGAGSYAERRPTVQERAGSKSKKIWSEALRQMGRNLDNRKEAVCPKLDALSKSVIESTRRQLFAMFEGLHTCDEARSPEETVKLELRRDMQDLVARWEESWKREDVLGSSSGGQTEAAAGDWRIPTEFLDDHTERVDDDGDEPMD